MKKNTKDTGLLMMNSKTFLTVAGILALILMAMPPALKADDTELQALRKQLAALSQRLDQLEASNNELQQANDELQQSSKRATVSLADINEKTMAVAEQVEKSANTSSWTDNISMKGDFRLRYEGIDEQGKDKRRRNRIRARASIIGNVAEQGEVGIGLASGGDDPVSTNQTLGGGGSSKGLNLDLAYFQWSGLEHTSLTGGKFKNPLYKPGKNSLLWDGDWNPEGLAVSWGRNDYFANLLGTWLESDSKGETNFSYGIQAGINKKLWNSLELTTGVAYFNMSTKGKGSFYGDDDDFFGNSFDPLTNTYLYDYELIELFADIGFDIGSQPAVLFFDFVQNQDADEFDTGYAIGFKYGSAKARGSWEGAIVYQDLEADATLGLVADSDFAGGGTNGKGFIFKAGYAVARNMSADLTYFITETDISSDKRHDYDRLQLDLAVKF